jgi:geranylgeranylglycerol-phosphate geranylgeranyltransferase
MVAAAVLVGAYVSRWPTRWWPAAVGALVAFLAASGANAINDAADARADAVNRPGRPLPSGRLSRRAAVAAAALAWMAAALLATALGPGAVLVVAGWIVVTAVYSPWLKRVPFLKNGVVALVASSPFVLGGITQDKLLLSLVPFSLAFLAHSARELVKDAEDLEGDRRAGARTAAVVFGVRPTLAAARGIVFVLMGAASLPYILPRLMTPDDVHPVLAPMAERVMEGIGYNWGYAALVIVADVLLVRTLFLISDDADARALAKASGTLKAVMAVGILAFVVGVA